jgi:hypothetical protein
MPSASTTEPTVGETLRPVSRGCLCARAVKLGHDADRLRWGRLHVSPVTTQVVVGLKHARSRSAVSVSSFANGALGEHRRHETVGMGSRCARFRHVIQYSTTNVSM